MSLQLLREATEFFASYAISPRIRPSLFVTIEFDKELWNRHKFRGECEPLDGEEGNPREFVIRIDTQQSKRNILRTIAHELVHVNQYAKGRLKDYVRTNKIRWDDWVYDYGDNDQTDCTTDFTYYLAGWEIEAAGFEENLYRLYMKHGRKKK